MKRMEAQADYWKENKEKNKNSCQYQIECMRSDYIITLSAIIHLSAVFSSSLVIPPLHSLAFVHCAYIKIITLVYCRIEAPFPSTFCFEFFFIVSVNGSYCSLAISKAISPSILNRWHTKIWNECHELN